jgi:uncharacterized membrane protein YgcG
MLNNSTELVCGKHEVLSLLPVDDMRRTQLAAYMDDRFAEYVWLLLVSELQTQTQNSEEFERVLQAAVIPPSLLHYFPQERLRDPHFLREERARAYNVEDLHARRLHRRAHVQLPPFFNGAREAAQTSAAYEFFKSFGALWYATFKCFFIRHNDDDDEGARVPKVSTKWTLDHMSRTFDAFEAIKVVNRENLPRDIKCVGWVYPGKNGKTFAKELRDHSFMEMMWLELKRESAGYLYDRNTIVWLFCAPVVPAKPRDFSIQPACLVEDPGLANFSGRPRKRKLEIMTGSSGSSSSSGCSSDSSGGGSSGGSSGGNKN